MPSATELAARLGLPFRDPSILEQALIHSSYRNEHPERPLLSNERLEFLGDAVVSLAVSRALYARYPEDDEGALTARRAAIVSTRGLARLAQRIDLASYLLLGQGADRANERWRASVQAAALEALVGAIYLDLGLDAATQWLLDLAAVELAFDMPALDLKSPKSRLQEVSYARAGHAPTYRVVSAIGPDHAKHYVVEALVAERVVGQGEGSSRREAESHAAEQALERLLDEPPGTGRSRAAGP